MRPKPEVKPPPILSPVDQTNITVTFLGNKPQDAALFVCGWHKPEDVAKKLSCIPYEVFIKEMERQNQ